MSLYVMVSIFRRAVRLHIWSYLGLDNVPLRVGLRTPIVVVSNCSNIWLVGPSATGNYGPSLVMGT